MNLKTFGGMPQYICVALMKMLRIQITISVEMATLLDLSELLLHLHDLDSFKETETSGRETTSLSGWRSVKIQSKSICSSIFHGLY